MKKIFFLMAFVLFLGVAVWASTSYDIKSALNISAGIISFGLIVYVLITFVFSLLAVMVFWMQRNNSLKYFCGALYFSVVNYAVLFLMKKYDYDVLVSGVHLSNLIGAGVSIMVSVLLIIGVYFAMSHRHREYG
ncbi:MULTISPECIES: hypothetical protein [Enterobacterales]|jgi:hypothetical protein|uniref:hypothetical protein n=1 Tax=Enterobacterales TaxID=91347 RepID=UPI0003BE8AD9|nr:MULTISPECIES: hypothetical protein [Enterobacteriaceae]EFA0779070.1 hypothetical protein [Escherichia coli]EFF9667437.1 hypothetical protein [Escherichia coli]EKJ3355970.1 hypothetical protein [Escherichia coli]ELS5398266.1 hypothetical protein [Escherichia coli]ESN47694.1 hypothetical protein L363_05075 [Klebsiella pneumoniae MGH 17]